MTEVYDRKTKQVLKVAQYNEGKLNFLYHTPLGRVLLRFASGHLCSNIYAWFNRRPSSKRKIAPFVKQNHIEVDDINQFNSFADFFTRKESRDICKDKTALISPADSQLLYYPIDNKQIIKIKNTVYSIEDLIGESIADFAGGSCLVFRLAVNNYHRYCYVDSGKLLKTKHIKGRLHTVSSISDQYRVFAQNDRVVSHLKTNNFGEVIQVEIGAMLVGRIHNHNQSSFQKGEEKGYFELGGSTIVLLTKKHVHIDNDIIKHSEDGIETKISYGEKIGGK